MKEKEIEKIRRYVDRVKVDRLINERYGMSLDDMCALEKELSVSGIGAIVLAFSYGWAKGYRDAKAEGKA